MTKLELETWFKNNACSTGGGGGGGVTPQEVQTMIDESISGKADTSSLSVYADSVEFDNVTNYVKFYHGGTGGTEVYSFDASSFVIDGMVDDVRIETLSGDSYLVIDFNTASGKEDIEIPISDIFDADNYYTKTEVDSAISAATNDMATQTWVGQQGYITGVDLSDYATLEALNEAVSGKADTSSVYTKSETSGATEIATALSGKQDTLSAGTNITIVDNVISATGGTTYSAGTNIDITNDTISCTLSGGTFIVIRNNKIDCLAPIRRGTDIGAIILGETTNGDVASGYDSIAVGGQGNTASGQYSYAEGNYTTAAAHSSHSEGWFTIANGQSSHSEGNHTVTNKNDSHAEGKYTVTNNDSEHSSGQYNNSVSASTTFGDSGNTLFSVGNGTADNARHNAFEIRQNGDIYCNNGTSDVKLQDYLQIRVVKITQAAYDALSPDYDNNVLYVIV
jgi:hypothetical protein